MSLAGVMASKNQVGFFSVIVLPMLEAFVEGFEAARPLVEQAKANVEWWKSRNETNYTIQDLSSYLAAMSNTMEQRASLIDFPSDADKESGMSLPETSDSHLMSATGRRSWRNIRDQPSMLARLTSSKDDRSNKVHPIGEEEIRGLIPANKAVVK
jgi:hypothetical protein